MLIILLISRNYSGPRRVSSAAAALSSPGDPTATSYPARGQGSDPIATSYPARGQASDPTATSYPARGQGSASLVFLSEMQGDSLQH